MLEYSAVKVKVLPLFCHARRYSVVLVSKVFIVWNFSLEAAPSTAIRASYTEPSSAEPELVSEKYINRLPVALDEKNAFTRIR